MRTRRVLATSAAAIVCFAGAATADEFVVELVGASFVYDGQTNLNIDLTVRPGDSVRWVWVSGSHNVVSGNPDDPNEGDQFFSGDPVPPPAEFVHVFDEPGEYPYHCDVHEFVGMISSLDVVCPADFNADFVVNTQDVLAFLNAWTSGDASADFNGDGTINTQDVLAFLNAWTSGC